jgi:putative transcriptional regulator
VGELLFLYECLTLEPTQLRPLADRLGLTVQAASHTYRRMAARGLVEVREGRYRVTVPGVAYLHEGLGRLGEDVEQRLARLHVVRSTRAVALAPITEGMTVSLELREGVLSARPGTRGSSRGRARRSAATGELVDVHRLEGIVPIQPGRLRIWTLPPGASEGPVWRRRLRSQLAREPTELLCAPGLEAYHLLRRATDRPILRFGVAPACREAAQVGVSSTILLRADELPHFLSEFPGPHPPPIEVRPLLARPYPDRADTPSGAGRSSASARSNSVVPGTSRAPPARSSAKSRSARPPT